MFDKKQNRPFNNCWLNFRKVNYYRRVGIFKPRKNESGVQFEELPEI